MSSQAPCPESRCGLRFQKLPRIDIVRDSRRIATTRRARFLLVAVAAALFGPLSMHGWGTHAGMRSDSATCQPVAAANNDAVLDGETTQNRRSRS